MFVGVGTSTGVSGSEFEEEERPAEGVTEDVVCASSSQLGS